MKNKVNLWGTHTATVLGITLVLLMLGLLLTLEYHSYRLTHDAQEKITYKVDLSPDVSDSLALAIKAKVEKMTYVKHVDYISSDKAAEIFSEDLGEDFVGFIGYNPLYPSLMVNFNVALLPDNSTQVLDRFCSEVGAMEGVTGVAFQENVVSELREVFYKLTWFLIIFVVLLLIITVVLIASLIRIVAGIGAHPYSHMGVLQPVRDRPTGHRALDVVWSYRSGTDCRWHCNRMAFDSIYRASIHKQKLKQLWKITKKTKASSSPSAK